MHKSGVEQMKNSMLFSADIDVNGKASAGFICITDFYIVIRVQISQIIPGIMVGKFVRGET